MTVSAAALVFLAGLVALIGGAELLVRGAVRLAAALGVSPLVIGLTVVAWGTGSPELAVGIGAALTGRPDLTVGNVVGSNITNVLLIVGLSALVAPLVVSRRLVRFDVPVMIGVSVATLGLSVDGVLGFGDGVVLTAAIIVYTIWSIRRSRREGSAVRVEYEREFGDGRSTAARLLLYGFLVAVGLGLVTVGSGWLVDGAAGIVTLLGLSELVIGLTIVALGTSLPEVATSVVASLRGERDIAVGNVVGSNIFNILAVLGITAAVAPDGISVAPAALRFDIPVMIAAAVACLPVFLSGGEIDRWEGGLFVALYVGWVAYLLMETTRYGAVEGFGSIMVMLVLPLTVAALVLMLVRSLGGRRG